MGCRSGRVARWRTYAADLLASATRAYKHDQTPRHRGRQSEVLTVRSCRNFHPSNDRGELNVLPSFDLYDAMENNLIYIV